MKNRIFKKFTIQKKDIQADGSFKCVFATMGIIDKDGDVTMPGFFGKQGCVVVPVHDWDHVPIGKAVCYEKGNEAIAEGRINLDIQSAKDWHSAMQFDLDEANGDPLMEWSYGFKTLDGGSQPGTLNDQRVRFLQPLADGTPGCKIFEVSPVLVGAGEKTRTLVAKGSPGDSPFGEGEEGKCAQCKTGTCCEGCEDCNDAIIADDVNNPKRFVDHTQAVLAAAEGLVKRGASLAGLRAKDGRELSAESKEKLALVADSLVKAAKGMVALVAPVKKPDEPTSVIPELAKEVARALRLRAGIQA